MNGRNIHMAVLAAFSLCTGLGCTQAPDTGNAAAGTGGSARNLDLAVQAREPVQVFDNLYFVGVEYVSSYLLTTGGGLVLIDTLLDLDGYADYLFDNIRTVGFDPAELRYVIVTHGHADHYGLAGVLQDRTDARIGMALEDWRLIESDLGDAAPQRDWIVEQDETLTLGETTLRFDITPGHTPGVVSIEFPVFDQGRRHTAYLHGGSAPRTEDPAQLQVYIDGFERAKAIPDIEVNISNHPFVDDFFARAEALAARGPEDPHPFVQPGAFYEWADGHIRTTAELIDELQQ